MIIHEKLEIGTKNFIENIKSILSTNKEQGMKLIGNIVENNHLSQRTASKMLGLCRQTIKKAMSIFKGQTPYKSATKNRGRKRFDEKYPEIVEQIETICKNFEFVEPRLNDEIIYIDTTAKNVRSELIEKYGYSEEDCPCLNTIRRLFKERLHYKLRRVKKSLIFKKIEQTGAIFENVNEKKAEVQASSDEVIAYSIDDKATKKIGNIADNGKSWIERKALDHDTIFEASVKPFGILNMKTKEVSVYCTKYSSTSEYKVRCLEEQIKKDLKVNPNIKKVYLFLDNGPENSSRRKLWMSCLIQLSVKLNLIIELVYYPPYHSKYNLIEHFWGVLQKSWGGLIIDTLNKLIGAINATKWSGINAKGFLIEEPYFKGKQVDIVELNKLIDNHVYYDNDYIKKWSLVITP